jgi:hypothetical protein
MEQREPAVVIRCAPKRALDHGSPYISASPGNRSAGL